VRQRACSTRQKSVEGIWFLTPISQRRGETALPSEDIWDITADRRSSHCRNRLANVTGMRPNDRI